MTTSARSRRTRLDHVAVRLASLLALGVSVVACSGDDGDELKCVEQLATDCVPTFDPTWDNVYANVVRQSCGGSGVSCHGPQGQGGGLELTSKDGAFASLLGDVDGRPRVLPNDPACSILIERLESTNPSRWMPAGASAPLPAGTRCAVQKWIEMGAKP